MEMDVNGTCLPFFQKLSLVKSFERILFESSKTATNDVNFHGCVNILSKILTKAVLKKEAVKRRRTKNASVTGRGSLERGSGSNRIFGGFNPLFFLYYFFITRIPGKPKNLEDPKGSEWPCWLPRSRPFLGTRGDLACRETTVVFQ